MKYILLSFIIIIFLWILCSLGESFTQDAYYTLQKNYIKKCNQKNYIIYEKLLLANCKCFLKTEQLFAFINPTKYYDRNTNEFFKTDVLSYNIKKSCKSISLYIIFICSTYFSITNYSSIKNFITSIIKTYFNIETLKNVITEANNNKWYILFALSIVAISIGIFKDKFSNKILIKIQDAELENIINTNRKISKELLMIEALLRQNITTILLKPKAEGVFIFLYQYTENKFSFCEYDCLNHKLKKRENYNNTSFSIKLNGISKQISNIRDIFDEYENDNNYFRPFFINKYFKGLNCFDPESFVKHECQLVNYEYLNYIITINIDGYMELINKSNFSTEYSVNGLNENINLLNTSIYCALIESIETIVRLDNYNKRFIKAMKFKKYREGNVLDKLISSINNM